MTLLNEMDISRLFKFTVINKNTQKEMIVTEFKRHYDPLYGYTIELVVADSLDEVQLLGDKADD